MKTNNIKKIAWSANLTAFAIVITLIIKYTPLNALSMPFGGSFIDISMLFISLVGFMFGIKYGFIVSFIYGLINFLVDGYAIHWSVIFDYLIGFMAFGVTGFFKDGLTKNSKFIIGFLTAVLIRYVASTLSGIIFFSEYAWKDWNVVIYSTVYNALYLISSASLCIVIGIIIRKRVLAIKNSLYQ